MKNISTATRDAARRTAVWVRTPFLVLAGVALLSGVDAALMLLGLPTPISAARLPDVHGMLLVLGFVGSLLSLERAVALGSPAGYAAPGLLGLGVLTVLSPAPLTVGKALLALGACAMVAVYAPLWRRRREDAVLIQALGAVLAVGAAVLWLGGVGVPQLLPWLVGFVVLTIGGERVELARIAMGPTAGRDLVGLGSLLATTVGASLLWPPAHHGLGLVLLMFVGWLSVHDVARRTIRSRGLPRFSAASLLAGYAWLGVAGLVWLVGGAAVDGTRYDAVVHATFLGFTVSMIMAHAAVILPAILRRPLPYHPAFFGPAVLLHASLGVRIGVGDGLDARWAWQAGGALNIVAVLGFLVTAAWSARRASR